MKLNDAVAVDGAVAPSDTLQIGGKLYSGVPDALTTGKIGAFWLDLFRRLLMYGFSFGSEATEIEDVAPAEFAPFKPVAMDQLSAPGVTDEIETLDFNRASAAIVVATIDTNAVFRLEGSMDGTKWFPIAIEDTSVTGLAISGAEATITANGPFYLVSEKISCNFARARFVSESGGTAAVADITMKAQT